jgi:hypothetical protein
MYAKFRMAHCIAFISKTPNYFPVLSHLSSFLTVRNLSKLCKAWKELERTTILGKESCDILAWHRRVCIPALSSSFQGYNALQRFLTLRKLESSWKALERISLYCKYTKYYKANSAFS